MTQVDSFDVLGVGVVAVDDFLHVRRYPGADEKEAVLRRNRKLGGLIGTALAAAARVGARCVYHGVWGCDELSAAVRCGLAQAGVDASRVVEDPAATVIHSLIIVAEDKHTRTIFYDTKMTLVVIEPVLLQLLQGARVFLTDHLGKNAAREARRLGVPVVADLEWADRSDLGEMMSYVDHLIVSAGWAQAFTGSSDPRRAARLLHGNSDRPCTAVTCGSDGCWFQTGSGGELRRQNAHSVSTVETTGCGDVFHGTYAACLARGGSVPESIAYASAAAGLFASRPSGWEHLPSHQEVAALLP